MKLNEKGVEEPVHLPWDAAQAALASGAYEAHAAEGVRGPDVPATQSPAPGTDPVGGKEQETEGNAPSNIAPTVQVDEVSGLPTDATIVAETVQQPAKAPKADDKKDVK